jgi:nicotinamidase-related amidase
MADRRKTFERELAPEPGRTALVVVDMQRGFLDPGEAMEVPPARAGNVTSLVVTGTMTDICVLATVIGAFHREYRVTVVEDGVSTLWPEIQRATLDIIGRAYGRIATAKEISDQISSGSQ